MKDQHIRQLLRRYVDGKCTIQEQLLVEEWYRRQQEQQRRPFNHPDPEGLQAAIWQQVQQQTQQRGKRLAITRAVLFKVAACCILLLGAGYVLQRLWPGKEQWQVATAEGRPLQVMLDDSSVVWLNAGSRFRYPARFSGHERQVELLTGEACLNVHQDPAHPFIIRAGGISTKVLGTVFNVRAYEQLAFVQVTVQEGKVAVQGFAGQEVVLLPDQQVTLYTQQQELHREQVDAGGMNGWISGRMLFNNERLDIIAAQLENKYHVQIGFADTILPAYRITAGFSATDTLQEVLDALSLANRLHYTTCNNKIIFSKQ